MIVSKLVIDTIRRTVIFILRAVGSFYFQKQGSDKIKCAFLKCHSWKHCRKSWIEGKEQLVKGDWLDS